MNMVGDDILTWDNKESAARLLDEVEEEEDKRKRLAMFYHHEELESDSELCTLSDVEDGRDSRRPRLHSEDTIAQRAGTTQNESRMVDESGSMPNLGD